MQGLTFWILRRGFWIPGTFELNYGSGILDYLTWAKRLLEELACVAWKWKYIKESFKVSLPADVLWGSFVTYSFLPHGEPLTN